jgi:aspartyl/asparaginyl-tRNA synthetase
MTLCSSTVTTAPVFRAEKHNTTQHLNEITQMDIEMGGAKFNVSTELKRTMIDAQYDYINTHREEYDPGKVDQAVRTARTAPEAPAIVPAAKNPT